MVLIGIDLFGSEMPIPGVLDSEKAGFYPQIAQMDADCRWKQLEVETRRRLYKSALIGEICGQDESYNDAGWRAT
jgi:hypothetical protein